MLAFLDDVSFQYLIIGSILMALAPFQPEPHLLEKVRMLKAGTLVKPIDIFDLFFHLIPSFFLLLKILRVYVLK